METETETEIVYFRIGLKTSVSNLARNIESTNTISIKLDKVIQDIEEESGTVTPLGSSQIHLKPRRFTSNHLSQLLHHQLVPESEYLGQEIARDINYSLANDNSLQEPVFVHVNVTFIEERHLVLPSRRRSASCEVFRRLMEEQRVEPMDSEEENETHQCSICTEDFSKIHGKIIRMPKCLHVFHHHCLFEWLVRQNSCPLCRTVPYEDDQETTKTTPRFVLRF